MPRVIFSPFEWDEFTGAVAMRGDDALSRGKFGMGTYRAAATWQDFSAEQP